MKYFKSFITIPIVFFAMSCSDDIERTYWENGNIQSALRYNESGELEGLAQWYYESGGLQQEATYLGNSLHGQMTRYHNNGSIESIGWYKDNLRDSLLLNYNMLGVKTAEANYHNDTLHGKFARYYADGQPMIEGEYYRGMLNGTWLFYDQTGAVIGKADYHLGDGIQKAWHSNGKISRIMYYKDNLQHGKDEHYDRQGRLLQTDYYEQGELIREEIH